MTLFLSFNQPIIFLLFVYLGLVSGVVFNIFSFISNILFIKLKKGLKKPVLNKKASKFKQEVEKTSKTQNKPQKQTQNNIVKNIIKNLPILIFIISVVFSYLTNLHLNFGHLRLIYVLIWVLFFFISKTLCKILANYFLSFYNIFIKRIKKNGRAKQ